MNVSRFQKLRSNCWLWPVVALFASACGETATVARTPAPTAAPSCPVPDAVQLEIEASDRVNLDENGRATPTRMWLYQLSDLNRLQSANFEDMWGHAQQTLAETRVGAEEVIVYPGQVAVHRFKREARADYLVAVANFREPQGEAWRTAQEWPTRSDPCQRTGKALAVPEKLRVRVFLEDSRIESVTNFDTLPKQHCPEGSVCTDNTDSHELRRNRHLRTFEEDPREPDATPGASR